MSQNIAAYTQYLSTLMYTHHACYLVVLSWTSTGLVSSITGLKYSEVTLGIAGPQVATALPELTCHTGSRSVTCQSAEVTFPPVPQQS